MHFRATLRKMRKKKQKEYELKLESHTRLSFYSNAILNIIQIGSYNRNLE